MKKVIAALAISAMLANLSSPAFAEDFVPEGVDSSKGLTAAVVKDLPNGPAGSLVRNTNRVDKEGNEYSGILETIEDGESFKYTVQVIYDGDNMTWEIIE
jgi:hypothetical protein